MTAANPLHREKTIKAVPPVKPWEMPRRIVINRCYGGFSLSQQVKDMYQEAKGDLPTNVVSDIPRDDPTLIQIIETLGLKASAGNFAKLCIVDIPDDVPEDGWLIQDYDGIEWVAEKHRIWNGDSSETTSEQLVLVPDNDGNKE